MRVRSLMSMLFSACLVAPVASFASDDPTENLSRIFSACKHLLVETKPYMFTVERDGHTAILFGTLMVGAPVHLLPDFAKDVIRSARFIAHAQMPMETVSNDPTNDVNFNLANNIRFDLASTLGGLGPIFVQRMIDAGVPAHAIPFLSPYTANSILLMLSGLASADLSDDDVERIMAVNDVVSELNPPASQDEMQTFAAESNLGLGVTLMAQANGAQDLQIIDDERFRTDLAKYIATDSTKDILKQLGRLERSPHKMPLMYRLTSRTLDKFLNESTKLMPVARMSRMAFVNEMTKAVEASVVEHPGLLISFDLTLVGGDYGMRRSLERRGFAIRQIETAEQWSAVKDAFTR